MAKPMYYETDSKGNVKLRSSTADAWKPGSVARRQQFTMEEAANRKKDSILRAAGALGTMHRRGKAK